MLCQRLHRPNGPLPPSSCARFKLYAAGPDAAGSNLVSAARARASHSTFQQHG